MFDFLKNKSPDENIKQNETFLEVACLLVHASKIDQTYTEKEKEIIKKTLVLLGADKNTTGNILKEAEEIEKDSNQILDFTKNLKNVEKETKLILIEALWNIIYSDSQSDMYEANLMRRLTGLLYLDMKEVGDIKEKFKKKLI
tara:strand:+ start:1404 stop:1832 length:429 start_codon:yes stop_codon:yes gene_type:complete